MSGKSKGHTAKAASGKAAPKKMAAKPALLPAGAAKLKVSTKKVTAAAKPKKPTRKERAEERALCSLIIDSFTVMSLQR